MARFRVEHVFRILGRGYALAGYKVEGTIKVGMRVLLPGESAPESSRPISNIEFVHKLHEGEDPEIALVIPYKDEADYSRVKALNIEGEVLDVLL